MKTKNQQLGNIGEDYISKNFDCPKCKKSKTLRKLPTNFKCADIICDFCGYLAQVKTSKVTDINKIPNTIMGAAWSVQKERMDAGIYFPLFFVAIDKSNPRKKSVFYLSADLQNQELFVPRKKLSSEAKRAGWQGFIYDLNKIKADFFVRLR